MRQLQSLKNNHVFSRLAAARPLGNFILFISFALTFSSARAADKPAPAKGGSKKTTINFEDQLVEGATQKPELFYLLQQRNNNFKRLIRLRENFIPEMRKSSEDVGRPTGKGIDD